MVSLQRELQIMQNLGRICLNNIKDYGADLKYEKSVHQAFKLRVDVGQRLHSRHVSDKFKTIFYKIVMYISFFCLTNHC